MTTLADRVLRIKKQLTGIPVPAFMVLKFIAQVYILFVLLDRGANVQHVNAVTVIYSFRGKKYLIRGEGPRGREALLLAGIVHIRHISLYFQATFQFLKYIAAKHKDLII